ncbi:MAG: hypothetical protein KJ556_00475 [Gammaproteobacteria bacterium]|nr:hypothetical protein [Gammaproteobacteria bacterium]MBU2058625.1 hypothetical protein [Gammaproteobacteria bacterium]MBU2173577.1 hypothetical protein [Gammaproteobacteria bacterium]MBU2246531.1 hypothetical protein [Gammaproteobacteria bacterium]MBU2343204.1 hypothetical protein [Gammaproteobacteria bacterium]
MNSAFPLAITGYSGLFPSAAFTGQFGGLCLTGSDDYSVSRKLKRYMSDATPAAIQAAELALDQAGLDQTSRSKLGLYVAQYGYLHPHLKDFIATFSHTKPGTAAQAFVDAWHSSRVSPFVVTQMLNNNLLGLLSLHLQQTADCAALVRDELAAATALEEAAFNLQQLYCQQALVVCAGAQQDLLAMQRLSAGEALSLAAPPVAAIACVLQPLSSLPSGQSTQGVIQQLCGSFSLPDLLTELRQMVPVVQTTDLLLLDVISAADAGLVQQALGWPDSQLIALRQWRDQMGCPGLLSAVFCGLNQLKSTSYQRFIAISVGSEGYCSAVIVVKDY